MGTRGGETQDTENTGLTQTLRTTLKQQQQQSFGRG